MNRPAPKTDARTTRPSGVVSGPDSALNELFDNHYDEVFRFCVARTGSPQAAEDAAAESFVDAARLFAAGRGDEIDLAWLRTVARSRVIDQWRADERHRRRIQRLVRLREIPEPPEPSFDEELILKALQALPSRQRSALTLRYLDECGVGEIADVLGVSYQAAESLLARARRGFARAFRSQR